MKEGLIVTDEIEERVLSVAEYVINTKSTLRETAKFFKTSKSTIHKDIRERLYEVNPMLHKEAEKVLIFNKEQRHIRGGMATKQKFEKIS